MWFGLTQYQGRVTPKYRRRRENPRQTRRNRERPKRIPASAPTSQISTSLPRARSRGFYWRARFPRVRLHSCRRDHHVSCQQPVLNPAVQLERYGLFPRFSPCGHASYHHSHHLNSVIYEGYGGRMAETSRPSSRSSPAYGAGGRCVARRELKRDFESRGTPGNRSRTQLPRPWYILYQGSERDFRCSFLLDARACASSRLSDLRSCLSRVMSACWQTARGLPQRPKVSDTAGAGRTIGMQLKALRSLAWEHAPG